MSSASSDIIDYINKDWAIQFLPTLTEDELIDAFALHLNDMIVHDFSNLIRALYRIDVSEEKIRQTLKENSTADAGKIIAHLVVERQKLKIKTREQFSPRDNHIDEEEKW
jgi:hypothetical protein